MAINLTRKKVIIAAVVLVLLAGGAVTYILLSGRLAPAKTTDVIKVPATGTAYEAPLQKAQVQVNTLVAAGDAQSVKQADAIVESQVTAADQSGNDGYIVSAQLTKAELLINTGRAQEALDSILLPLNDKYGNDKTYEYDIDGDLSLAYRWLNDQTKADEYFNKIPGESWND